MSHIFISYASPDAAFALRLARIVELLGYAVWIDQWEIGIGDSLLAKIGTGIDQSAYMIIVLSRHTLLSAWVEQELHLKQYEEITQRKQVILPIIIEDCAIPPFLRSRRIADFRRGYAFGVAQLATTLHTYHAPQAIPGDTVSPNSMISYTNGMIKSPQLIDVTVELGIPSLGTIAGTWKPDENEQNAAWELYIELMTRISVVELDTDEGMLREGLTSLYRIFTITRDILRKYGPSVARPKAGGEVSFGLLAIQVLNLVLRPVLTKWHPLLLDYEHTREAAISVYEHERRWGKAEALRQVLRDTRVILADYITILAHVAGIPANDMK